MSNRSRLVYRCICFATLLCLAPLANAAFSFTVSVNTSSIGAIPGFLDFEFSPFATSPDATANVTNFTTAGVVLTTADGGNFDCNGPYATALPSDLTLCAAAGNGSSYVHNITDFGTLIQFNLALGLVLPNTGGAITDTTFGMALYENGVPFPIPHLNDGTQGDFLFTIDLHPNGTYTINNASSGAAAITDNSAVPEPSTLALMGIALCVLLYARCKKLVGFVVILTIGMWPLRAAEPQAKTVPWNSQDFSVPHETYAYKTITLKGTSSLAGPTIRATWDFGDGTEPASFIVKNPLSVSARHSYVGAAGATFTARLTVTDVATGESSSSAYPIVMREKNLESETNVAIDEGLWYLHTHMSRAEDLAAFERNGHRDTGDSADPYTATVARLKRPIHSKQDSEPDYATLLDLRAEDAPGVPLEQRLIDRQDEAGFWSGHLPDTIEETSLAIRMLTPLKAHIQSGSVTNVSSKVNITSSGPLLNRSTNTYNSNLTVTNTSGATITGPISVGLHITPGSVLLVNSNGTFNGDPYRSITAGDLAAGQAITVQMRYSAKPSSYVGTAYSGTLPPSALGITCPTNSATTGVAYSSSYAATGGVLAYTYATSVGTLPHNLVLDTTTGTVTGTPDTVGDISFTAQVTDSAGTPQTATANCDINVVSANHTPVATPQSPSTNEDIALPITLAGTDADGNPLTFAIVTGPAHGGLGSIGSPSCLGNPSTCTAAVTYTPAADYNGGDSFTFKVNDGTVDSPAAAVSLTVNAVNDAPSFTKGTDQSANKSSGLQTVTNWATAISPGPANESGQTVHFNITGNTTPGIFSVAPAVSPTGTLTYTPSATTGVSTITLNIQDNGGTANSGADTSPTQNFTITVNDPPQITSANNTTFAPGKTGQTFGISTTGFPTGASMVISDGGGFPSAVTLHDNLNGTATLQGTPAALTQNSSPYHVNITAHNGVAPDAVQAFTLNITCPTITVSNGPASPWQTTFNSAATAAAFTQSGGNGTIVWSASGLPTNLTMASGTGVISGTPNVTGTFSATITATDAGGCTGTKSLTVAVGPSLSTQSFTGVGNTQFLTTGVAGAPSTPFVATATTLLNGATPVAVSTQVTTASCSSGGTLSAVDSSGHFIFTPNVNATSAACTYTASSNTGAGSTGAASTTASLNFTLNNKVWYVDNATAAVTHDGRSNTPLTSMPGGGVTGSGDFIYVAKGSGNTTGAYALLANQSLLGASVTLSVGGILTVTGASGNEPTLSGTLSASGASGLTVNGIAMSTGSSTAVNFVNSDGTFTFKSISTNGGTKGIIWNNASATSGSFTINGTGGLCDSSHISASDCTGGTIQAASARGAEFVKANNVTLNNMYFKGDGSTAVSTGSGCNDVINNGSNTPCNAALYLSSTTTASLNKIYLDGTGSADMGLNGNSVSALTTNGLEIANFTGNLKSAAVFQNLTGTVGISGLNVHNNTLAHNFLITNNAGTANITFTSPVIQNSPLGGVGQGNADGINAQAYNAGTTLNITSNNGTFNNIIGDTTNWAPNSGAHMTAILSGGTSTSTGGIYMASTGNNTQMNYTITGLTSVTTNSTGSNAITAGRLNGTNISETGTISNNTIVTGSSSCSTCSGIVINSFAASGLATISVTGNNVSGNNFNGMNVVGAQGSNSLNLTIQGNTFATTQSPANSGYGIDIISGGASGDATCMFLNLGDMTAGHTVPANKNTINGSWGSGANKISLAIFDNSTLGMVNYSGSTDSQASAWATASNNSGADAFHFGTHQFGGGTCP